MNVYNSCDLNFTYIFYKKKKNLLTSHEPQVIIWISKTLHLFKVVVILQFSTVNKV